MASESTITESAVRDALAQVKDPDIGMPLTDLGMVKSVAVDGADVSAEIYLTIAGCPMKNKLVDDSRAAIEGIEGVGTVTVTTDVMNDEQRRELRKKARGGVDEPEIPFSKPDCHTRVYAVASGKGGVGKSSMTVNIATALAAKGLNVGVLDADIYGHSIPGMLGSDDRPYPPAAA